MKRKNFILVFALVAFGFLACDNESIQLNTNELETTITCSHKDIFAEIANSLGVVVTFESVDVYYGLCPEFTVPDFEFDRLSTRNIAVRDGWDIDNSTTIRATTGLGDSFTAIATPHIDNPNTLSYVMMSSTGETVGFAADIRFDEINGTVFLELMEEMKPIDIIDIAGSRWRDNLNLWWHAYNDCIVRTTDEYCAGVHGRAWETICDGFGRGLFTVSSAFVCLIPRLSSDSDNPWREMEKK